MSQMYFPRDRTENRTTGQPFIHMMFASLNVWHIREQITKTIDCCPVSSFVVIIPISSFLVTIVSVLRG